MIAGHAVFEAVHPARIFRHIAADAANHLAGGIRGVIEPVSCNGARHPAVDDPGLHRDALIGQIKVEHPTHATGHHQKRLLIHQRSPREAGAASASHKRHTVLMAALQHRSDLFGGLRQHRQGRTVALKRQSVTVVTEQFLTLRHDGPRGQTSAQIPLQH